jgi:hypothetical protein
MREIEAKLWAEVYAAAREKHWNAAEQKWVPAEQEADLALQRFRERFGGKE